MIRIPPQLGGWLEVICGPMFSGKSEEMIRRLRRAEIAGQRVVIFKPDRRSLRRDGCRQSRGRADARRADPSAESARAGGGLRRRGDRRGAVPRAGDRRVRARARGSRRSGRGGRPRSGLPAPPVRADARAPLTRGVRGQAPGRLPPLRRPGETTSASSTAPAPYSGETVVVGAAEQYEARCRGCHEAGVGAALVAA